MQCVLVFMSECNCMQMQLNSEGQWIHWRFNNLSNKRMLTMPKYYNAIIRHRQSTLASYFCNYGKQKVAGCECGFHYVLLSIVLFCSVLLWLSNPAPNTTSQTKKGACQDRICQLVDFQNTFFVSWLSEGSWCVCLLVAGCYTHMGEVAKLHCLKAVFCFQHWVLYFLSKKRCVPKFQVHDVVTNSCMTSDHHHY